MRRTLWLAALALCVGVAALSAVCPAEPDLSFPELLGEHEEPSSAIEALRPAAETDPNAALQLGWLLYVYENDTAGAKALFEQVVEADPGNVWAHVGLGSIASLAGDYATMCEQAAAIVAHDPEHPLVELALYDLHRLWSQVPEARAGTTALLRGFLDDPRVTSHTVRGVALDMLRRDLGWNGLMDERDALLPMMGAVRSWRFAGPFGPFADLTFFAELEPDADPFLADQYVIDGDERATRRYDSRGVDIEPPWVDHGVYYAETFVRTAAPVRALLEVSSADSVRVELNGGTIYLKDEFHTFVPKNETVEVMLPAGWSRLRVKYQAPDTIVMRLLDGRGRPLEVEVDPTAREIAQDVAAQGRLVPTACEAYLNALTEADNPLVLWLVARLHRMRGNTEAAKVTILRSLDAHEGWAASQFLAGMIIGSDSTQPERIARSGAKAHYRRAIELLGTCPPALYTLALYEEHEERYDEAIDMLEQCVEQAPDAVLWYRALYDIFSTRGWAKEREWALEAMRERNADSPDLLWLALRFATELHRFDALHEAEMRLHKGSVGSTYLAGALQRAGRFEEAIVEFERLAREYPENRWHTRTLITLYKTTERFGDAARLVRVLLAEEPRDTGLIKELAAIELKRGRPRDALRLWRQVLELEPADLGARKALALHGRKEEFDEHDIDVAPYLADTSLRERYAEYASVLVVDYSIEQIFDTGSSRQLVHQLVLVNTKAGIQQWGEFGMPYGGELLALRVIKPDGTIIEPELVEGKDSISLAGLAEGDFVEMKYIASRGGSRGGRASFLGPRFFFCSGDEPMHLTRYLVMAPRELELEIEQLNMDEEPTTWTRGPWRFWQWERHEVEPIRPEPGGVSADEYMPWVRVGFGQRIAVEPAVYEDDNIGMTTPTLELRRLVEELITPEMGHEEIVRTLHTWVNTNIDGGNCGPNLYSRASHTLGEKRGCRMALLKALLDMAGIGSHVVMVRNTPAFDSEVFPSENRFSYGLLLVDDEHGQPSIWLDLNNKFYPYGLVHTHAQGGRAVVLRNVDEWTPGLEVDLEQAREEVRVPVWPETHVPYHIDADLHVDKDGVLDATVSVTLTSLMGAGVRSALEQVDEDQLERMNQMTVNHYFRGATVSDYSIENRTTFSEPFVARATFTAPQYARVRGRTLRFNQPLMALNLRKTYARVTERKTPLALFGLPSSRTRITITLPEGVTLTEGLSPLVLESDFGSYKFSFEYDEAAHRAVIEREFILPNQRVQPADYERFVAFCRTIDEHEEGELKVLLPEEAEPEAEQPADVEDAGEPEELKQPDEPADEGEAPVDEKAPEEAQEAAQEAALLWH